MAAGDKYLTAAKRNLNKEQLFRLLCREDANGNPFLNVNAASGPVSILQPWYDSLSVKPSEGLWTDLKIMAQSFVDVGKWNLFDFLQIVAAMETDEQRLRPLITTSGIDVTPVNSPTLSVNGVQGNGTSSYLNFNWNPSTNGVNFTLNNNGFGIFRQTGGIGSRTWMGCATPTSKLSLWLSSSIRQWNNSNPAETIGFIPSGGAAISIHTAYRNSSTIVYGKRNFVGSYTTGNSLSIPNLNAYGCCLNNNGVAAEFNNGIYRAFFYGGFDLFNDDDLANILNTFFVSRGLAALS